MLTMIITAIPTTIAVAQGVKEQKRLKAEAESEASASPTKFTLHSSCKRTKAKELGLDGAQVVLKDGNHYLATSPSPNHGHPFSGFILPHIDKSTMGLVSTISFDPPMLNWIYVHTTTGELKHGTGSESKLHIHGDWSIGKEGELLLNGKEKFICIRDDDGDEGKWGLYFQEEMDVEEKNRSREGRAFFAVKLVMTPVED